MNKLISQAEKIPLSGDDIYQILNDTTKIYRYSDLHNIHSIDQLFTSGNSSIMLLFQVESENSGHWCILIKHAKTIYEWFDPYGLKMDEELKFADYNLRIHNNQRVGHMTALFAQNPNYKVIQNTTQLQRFLKDVNTCGRHCCVRGLMKNTPLNKYVDLFKNQKNDADYIVSSLTILFSFIK